MQELDAKFASQGGAGTAIQNMVNAWQTTTSASDYSAVTLGQLKAVAQPFYTRLGVLGVSVSDQLKNFGYPATWAYDSPWDPTAAANDYSMVNAGQLKMAFSFDFSTVAAAIRSGFNQNTLPANDDGSTALVPMGFNISFYGSTYSSCYVNNNGNFTFTSSLIAYTPTSLQNVGLKIIAAYWADVDTRGGGSLPVTYGTGTVNGRSAFGANYIQVGYFNTKFDKLNDFQLILISRSDTGTGNFDIEFNYNSIEWETGDHYSSGGVNGYGGFPARVGITDGGTQTTELSNSGKTLKFLDTILSTGMPNYADGLRYQTRNSTVPGRLVFQVRSGAVLGNLQVSAGPDKTLPSGTTSTTLAGTASAPGGGTVSSLWAVVNYPSGGAVTFSNATSLTPTATFTTSGTYELQLTVTSSADPQISAADTVKITVP